MDKSEKKQNYYDKRPNLKENGPSKIKEHFNKGMTAFLIVLTCIVCYFAILRFSVISDIIGEFIGIISPIIYGVVIAYLLNPIVKKVEIYVSVFLKRYIKKEAVIQKISRCIGIIAAMTFAIALVVALLNMVVPELYKSIRDLVITLPDQISAWIEKIGDIQEENTTVNSILKNAVVQGSLALENWVKTDLLRQTNVIMSSVTTGVLSVVNTITDFLIGIIVAVYVLFSKEQFLGQVRKTIYALMPARKANLTLHLMRKSNEIFGGFIIGKIIDSAIIGVLCFIGVSVLKMPYKLLISVIVGVTNVIPVFGPYIGAVPCTILIFLVDPMKGLYFLIFILLLQQLDGNVIGPTILGDSTGLSAFWVIFSIVVGGGLFGVFGMLVGVPSFAVIYYIAEMLITHKLEQKNLPTETEKYNDQSYVDDNGQYIVIEEKREEKGE